MEWRGTHITPVVRPCDARCPAHKQTTNDLVECGMALSTGAAYHNDDDGVGVADRIVVLYQGPASARPHVIVDSPY